MLKMNLIRQEELYREVYREVYRELYWELCDELYGELYREVYWELRREVYGALGLQIRAEFFKFQNFKSIILYAKNEFNYTRGIAF